MATLFDIPCEDYLNKLTKEDQRAAKHMWSALWSNYIRNKGTTSSPYWAEKFSSPLVFAGLLYSLRDYVQSTVIPARNWAELQLNETTLLNHYTEEELVQFRVDNKIGKYMPSFVIDSEEAVVKTKEGYKQTGIIRTGFAKTSESQFYYDTSKLAQYKDVIVRNTNKGMIKMREQYPLAMDDASYDQISLQVVEELLNKPEIISIEGNRSDSRGRAIHGCLKRVANPIGYKDFRSLITIPE